ncbi:unnamed protein product, partial [Allacma fusca]
MSTSKAYCKTSDKPDCPSPERISEESADPSKTEDILS